MESVKPRGNPRNLRKDGAPGHRGAGGRPPDAWKAWVRETLYSPEARKFIEDLVKGNPIEEKAIAGKDGEIQMIKVPALAAVRLKAIQYLTEYIESKAPTAIGTGDDGLTQLANLWRERYK